MLVFDEYDLLASLESTKETYHDAQYVRPISLRNEIRALDELLSLTEEKLNDYPRALE